MEKTFHNIVEFIRELYKTPSDFIPLHAPVFKGNEKKYLNDCIDSTFVSSVGKYVDQFEEMIAKYTGAKYAVAAANGTVALQIALEVSGTNKNDLVITQPLTFIATANAIVHAGAQPVFIDVDRNTLGLSPDALGKWLEENTIQQFNKETGSKETLYRETKQKISACVPMHTFGHPCQMDEIVEICNAYHITIVEDAAESLGSYYKDKHTGTFGQLGIFSFNGNKTITTGGGGMIVTDNEQYAKLAKHLTTTAKIPHPYEYKHDYIGYNFRLTNLAAALGVAQMEKLDEYLEKKREIAQAYNDFFSSHSDVQFFSEPKQSKSNYWLNILLFNDEKRQQDFLEYSNENGVMTRPAWTLMSDLEIYKDCIKGDLSNSQWLAKRIVNVPSSVKI